MGVVSTLRQLDRRFGGGPGEDETVEEFLRRKADTTRLGRAGYRGLLIDMLDRIDELEAKVAALEAQPRSRPGDGRPRPHP